MNPRPAALAVALAIAALAMPGAASAAHRPATSFDGTCDTSGSVFFSKPVFSGMSPNHFRFSSDGTCNGTLKVRGRSRGDHAWPANIRFYGSGNVSCFLDSDPGAKGVVSFRDFRHPKRRRVAYITNTAQLVHTANAVTARVDGGQKTHAVGRADFVPTEEAIADCGTGLTHIGPFSTKLRTGPSPGSPAGATSLASLR